MSYSVFAYVIVVLNIPLCFLSLAGDRPSYEELYRAGKEAYLNNDWEDCVKYFEECLSEYASYQDEVVNCRSSCDRSVGVTRANDLIEFFGIIVEIALCNFKCEKYMNLVPPTFNAEVKEDLDSKIPYEYLQLCYFKVGNVQKASSSAYTFLAHHPDHEVMQHNLEFYLSLPHLDASQVIYLENDTFQKEYHKGTLLYVEESYEEVIETMEKALVLYLLTEDRCRYLCEGPWSSAVITPFYVSVANHFTHALRCKLNCPKRIYLANFDRSQSILASHYHYLQYAYYKVGDLKNAYRAVASYTLLQPNDTVMEENHKFFSSLDGVKKEWFQAREESLAYHTRNKRENEIFRFIETSFGELQDTVTDNQVACTSIFSTNSYNH